MIALRKVPPYRVPSPEELPDRAAARADFLRRLGRTKEARLAYEEALLLTDNQVERQFLAERLSGLDADPS